MPIATVATNTAGTSAFNLDAVTGLVQPQAPNVSAELVEPVQNSAKSLETFGVKNVLPAGAGSANQQAETQGLIMCRDQIDDKGREWAKAKAGQWDKACMADPNAIAELGAESLEKLNRTIDEMFTHFAGDKSVKIPELTAAIKATDQELKGFRVSNEKRMKQLTKDQSKVNEFIDWLRQKKDLLRLLIDDTKDLESRVTSILNKVSNKEDQLKENVRLLARLYDANELTVNEVTYYVAGMEYLRDIWQDRAEQLQKLIDQNDPETKRQAQEAQGKLLQMISALDVRIQAFKERHFIAVATSPEIRNIQMVSYMMAMRLAMVRQITIPVIKLTAVKWMAAIQASQGADMVDAATTLNNQAMEMWGGASGMIIPEAIKRVMSTGTTPEAIMAMTNGAIAQLQGWEDGAKYFVERTGQIEGTMRIAAQMLETKQQETAEKMLQNMRNRRALADAAVRAREAELQQPLQLVDVPDAVIDQMGELPSVQDVLNRQK